ncbi:MAG: TIM44-like domain-containing protein [Alphaproteobacteria bacterium]
MTRKYWLMAMLVVSVAVLPALAEARAGRGSSMGSRGTRTYQAPPATQTAPAAKPMERSATQPNAANPGAAQAPTAASGAGAQAQPSFFQRNPFASGLLGGLVGAGIGSMLFGGGLNLGGLGLAGGIGLMLQLALIGGAIWLLIGFLRRRAAQQAFAGAGGREISMAREAGTARNFGGPVVDTARLDVRTGRIDETAAPAAAAQIKDDIGLAKADFDTFERMLAEVQTAFSRADIAALRRLASPEMVSYFNEQLTDDASAGLSNRIEDVKLEQGDLAEAWREGTLDYATLAMRWSALDYTVETETDRVSSGSKTARAETIEFWTFVRGASGRWLLSAIQQG